jgi:hypothetical protein
MAPIEQVAGVFARSIRALSWERDVHGQQRGGPGEILYQFKGHPWTGATGLPPAALFSRDLNGRVFVYGQQKTTGATYYHLYDSGTLVESYCFAPDRDETTGRPSSHFQSRLQRTGPSDDQGVYDFIDEVCRWLDLYVELPPIAAAGRTDDEGRPYWILADSLGLYRREDYERVDWLQRDPRPWPKRRRDW